MQKIIRNVSNLDRAPVDRVPVERVYEVVKSFGEGAEFASRDIADTLGVREYKVRGSICWLLKRHVIEKAGVFCLTSKEPYCKRYEVQQYRLKPAPGEAADFAALMSVFCGHHRHAGS